MKMGKLEKLFVNSPGHSQSVSRRAQKLLSYTSPRPGQRYLDVGTGNGQVAIDMAANHQLDVTGVDVDKEQIRLAREAAGGLKNVQFLPLDACDLPFAEGSFDIVSAFKVTHHIANWQEAVQEMMRVLRAGGYLVFADLVVPERLAAFGARLVRGVGLPTVDGLSHIAQANGLSIVRASRKAIEYEVIYRKGAGRA